MTLVNTLSRVPLVHDDPIDIPIDKSVLNSAKEARRRHYRLKKPTMTEIL